MNDLYGSHLKQDATEKEKVNVGRIATVVLMVVSALLALSLNNALELFELILMFGAGTGLIFILRWFWWRISAYSELAAMVISFVVAVYFEFLHPVDLPGHARLVYSVGITTAGWVLVTFLTRPTAKETLIRFYRLIRPHSAGWDAVIQYAKKAEELAAPIPTSSFMLELSCMFAGCFLVYGLLFSTGFLLYGALGQAAISMSLSLLSGWVIYRNWSKIQQ